VVTRDPDRRNHRRQPTTYRATAVFNNGSETVACSVIDMSANGARIKFATAVDLPVTFVLEIPRLGLSVRSVVIWNEGDHYGVQFVWPQHARNG
jgi:hypothetical protein